MTCPVFGSGSDVDYEGHDPHDPDNPECQGCRFLRFCTGEVKIQTRPVGRRNPHRIYGPGNERDLLTGRFRPLPERVSYEGQMAVIKEPWRYSS